MVDTIGVVCVGIEPVGSGLETCGNIGWGSWVGERLPKHGAWWCAPVAELAGVGASGIGDKVLMFNGGGVEKWRFCCTWDESDTPEASLIACLCPREANPIVMSSASLEISPCRARKEEFESAWCRSRRRPIRSTSRGRFPWIRCSSSSSCSASANSQATFSAASERSRDDDRDRRPVIGSEFMDQKGFYGQIGEIQQPSWRRGLWIGLGSGDLGREGGQSSDLCSDTTVSGPEGARLGRREEGEGRGARCSDLLLETDNNRK